MEKINQNIKALTEMEEISKNLLRVKQSEMTDIDISDIDKLKQVANSVLNRVGAILILDRQDNTFLDEHMEAFR
jgi:hypothetical protein